MRKGFFCCHTSHLIVRIVFSLGLYIRIEIYSKNLFLNLQLRYSLTKKYGDFRVQMPRLLKSTVLSPNLQTQTTAVSQQQNLSQIWRSETIVQVFLDFWLDYTMEDQFSPAKCTNMNVSLAKRVNEKFCYWSPKFTSFKNFIE